MAAPTDRSNIVTIATCALTGTFITVFIARQIMKAIVFRKVAIDDLFILLATTFAVGLSVMTLILASNGLGVLSTVTVDRANLIMKGYYVSELLYISSMCFAKLSILVLFYNVVALSSHRFVVMAFGIFVLIWSLASALATAFQCGLPRPWEMMTLRCFNTRIFWIAYCAIDMSTEIAIITLSIDLVAHLKVRLSRKLAVVACFAPRILVIMAALVRAIYLYQVTPHTNPVYHLWISTVCTQVHICTSICTACIPYMVPFFKGLQSNIWRSYSTKSWNMVARSSHLPGHSPKLLQKREAKLRYYFPPGPTQGIDRVSKVPPYIPSPEPLSPFLPPPDATHLLPNSTADVSDAAKRTSFEASTRGTSISGTFYDSDPEDILDISVRQALTKSSLLLPEDNNPSISSDQLRIPLPTYSPSPSNGSSIYSSCSSTPSSPTPTPQSPLLPRRDLQDVSRISRVLQAQTVPASSTRSIAQPGDDDTTRHLNRQTLPNAIAPHTLDDFTYPTRSASTTYHPKFSTTPRLNSPPPTIVPLPSIQR